jgi:hypothetical protein
VHVNFFGINNKLCHFEWLFNANEMRKCCTEHSIFSYTSVRKFIIIIIIIIIIITVTYITTSVTQIKLPNVRMISSGWSFRDDVKWTHPRDKMYYLDIFPNRQ